MNYLETYEIWKKRQLEDPDLIAEMIEIEGNEQEIKEQLCDVCHKMWQLGWVAANDGNVCWNSEQQVCAVFWVWELTG